jgi:hypothetical protein
MTVLTMNELYCIFKQEYKVVSSEIEINNERIISTNMTFNEVNEFVLGILNINNN